MLCSVMLCHRRDPADGQCQCCFFAPLSLLYRFCYSLKNLSFLGFLMLPFDVALESFKYAFVLLSGIVPYDGCGRVKRLFIILNRLRPGTPYRFPYLIYMRTCLRLLFSPACRTRSRESLCWVSRGVVGLVPICAFGVPGCLCRMPLSTSAYPMVIC